MKLGCSVRAIFVSWPILVSWAIFDVFWDASNLVKE